MPQKINANRPPTGWRRFVFRAPLIFYRLGLGWLLGNRFLLLQHVGRKSGLHRQAVLEIVKFEPDANIYYVASGFGKKSQWVQNLLANPEVTIQVGRQVFPVTAEFLTREDSGEKMVEYAHQHPRTAKNLMKVIGFQVDGRDEEYYELGRDHLPFIKFVPRKKERL